MAFQEFAPNSTLFQYTSIDGLKGMLESKKIWFSDLRSLNDPRELIFGHGQIQSEMAHLRNDRSSKWSPDLIERLINLVNQSIKNTDYYSCCFCPRGDQMPMWRHYGAEGKGVAIGFRPRALTDFPGRFQKVRYLRQQDDDDSLYELLRELLEKAGADKGDIVNEKTIELGSAIMAHCTSVKHSSWDHEAEIRCTYTQPKTRESTRFLDFMTSKRGGGQFIKWQEPESRKVEDREIRFIPFAFGKGTVRGVDPSGAIEKIILGPNCQVRQPELEALMTSEGFSKFKISNSECVWR